MTQRFQALRVAATRREIGGRALTVDFDVAGQLSKAFAWRAGSARDLALLAECPGGPTPVLDLVVTLHR